MPVISSACGGPEYIVTDTNGKLYPKGNIEELKKNMLYMYQNKNRYNPEDIRNACRARYGENIIVQKLMKVYKQIKGESFGR